MGLVLSFQLPLLSPVVQFLLCCWLVPPVGIFGRGIFARHLSICCAWLFCISLRFLCIGISGPLFCHISAGKVCTLLLSFLPKYSFWDIWVSWSGIGCLVVCCVHLIVVSQGGLVRVSRPWFLLCCVCCPPAVCLLIVVLCAIWFLRLPFHDICWLPNGMWKFVGLYWSQLRGGCLFKHRMVGECGRVEKRYVRTPYYFLLVDRYKLLQYCLCTLPRHNAPLWTTPSSATI